MAYIVGTYNLKFYKELTNERGVTVRLEIHQRGWSGRTIEIGKLSGLNFFIQGSQNEIDAPIVKTSAKFGILDNPFESSLDSDGEKYENGHWVRYTNWTEFYTSDSTLYLVKLHHNGRVLWSGYITPDSFQESLDAFGVIQITARDNLGHLQDFEFDMAGDDNGLVNIYSLVVAALTKVNFPMNAIFQDQSDDNELRSADDAIGVRDLCVNVSAFEGKNWFEALEEVLLSVGWCMRFCDVNGFEIGPLRQIARYGWQADDDPPAENVQFIGRGSGTRTYDPAYKEIVEKIDFGQEDKLEMDMQKMVDDVKHHSSTTHQFIIEYSNDFGSGWNSHSSKEDIIQSNTTSSFNLKAGQFKHQGGYHHLCPKNYALQEATEEAEGDAARNYIFLLANIGHTTGSGTSMTPEYDNIDKQIAFMNVMSPALKFEAEFTEHPMCFYNNQLGVYPYNLKKIIYYISYQSKDGSTTRYWNGYTWVDSIVELTQEYDPLNETGTKFSNEMTACEDCGAYGKLAIVVRRIQYQAVGGIWTSSGFSYLLGYGCYARLRSFWIESAAAKVMKSDTVKTVVNTANNVRCKRTPLFGCMPQSVGFAFSTNYQNAFFYYNSDNNPVAAPYNWKWTNDSVALPFPVKIHQQLLMFHSTVHELLEGACRPCDYLRVGSDGELRYDCTIGYKNIQHLLASVNHDLLTDRFVTAILRDFKSYGQLWSGSETQDDDGTLS